MKKIIIIIKEFNENDINFHNVQNGNNDDHGG